MRTPRLLLALPIVLLASQAFAADEDYVANSDQNKRPMLGVEMSPVSNNIQDREGLDPHQGVQVQSTYSGTAADAMGLQKDDVILGINGQPITSMTDLRNEVGLTAVGDPIEVQVTRNGETLTLGSDVKPWPEHIPYEKLDAAAEKRFRDWQDRRQQRLADEVARLDRDTERLRKRLAGEDGGAGGGSANRGREGANSGPAFRFRYGLASERLPQAKEIPTVDVSDVVVPAAEKPWRVAIIADSGITTL